MRILKFEIKKLVSLPMLWIFLVLCLGLNGAIVISETYGMDTAQYLSYISKTVPQTGIGMGKEFDQKLSKMPEEKWKDDLVLATRNAQSSLKSEDAVNVGEILISQCGLSGFLADKMKEKYKKLQGAVETLKQQEADLSVYAADITYDIHQLLFSSLFRAITTESCLFAVLLMLYVFGFEEQNHTEQIVYSTYRGRKVQKEKIGAGLLIVIMYFVILTGLSLFCFFSVYVFSGIWDSSVSSQFNYIQCSGYTKPFWTWIPFTLRSYFVVMLVLAVVLTIVFSLFGALIGLLCRNTYMGFVMFLAIALGMVALPFICADVGIWEGYFLAELLPTSLWLCSSQWLTDLGTVSLMPWHETIGLIGNIIVFIVIVQVGLAHFAVQDCKKD